MSYSAIFATRAAPEKSGGAEYWRPQASDFYLLKSGTVGVE